MLGFEIFEYPLVSSHRTPSLIILCFLGIVSTRYSATRSSFANSCYNTLSSLGELSINSSYPYASITPPFVLKRSYDQSSNGCNTTFDPVTSCSQDAHADRTEVFLHADYKGFGFNINAPSHPSDTLTNPPNDRKLEEGHGLTSVAEEFGINKNVISRAWKAFHTIGTTVRKVGGSRRRKTTAVVADVSSYQSSSAIAQQLCSVAGWFTVTKVACLSAVLNAASL
ncbi:glutamate receptor-interacting protein 1 [Trichonephila clavipes]|nr:glutamate receptor-interacting protein 1 [Trichonephila clavipes]